MAILRAGPWGNLTDSFQDVPSDVTADELTLYPVNCAKTDWLSGQAWGAYYEVEDGCCTPSSLNFLGVTWVSTGSVSISGTLTRNPEAENPCEFFIGNDGDYRVELVFFAGIYSPSPPYSYIDPYWYALVYDESLANEIVLDGRLGPPTDECDPVGTYSSSDGGSFSISLP